jgi:hypothetical protein
MGKDQMGERLRMAMIIGRDAIDRHEKENERAPAHSRAIASDPAIRHLTAKQMLRCNSFCCRGFFSAVRQLSVFLRQA